MRLTDFEEIVIAKIVQSFHQRVFGIDLKRYNGKSYITGLDGWSLPEPDRNSQVNRHPPPAPQPPLLTCPAEGYRPPNPRLP